jgi:hypothetical protein
MRDFIFTVRRMPWGALAFAGLVCVLGIFGWVAGFIWNLIARGFNEGELFADDTGWRAAEKFDNWNKE